MAAVTVTPSPALVDEDVAIVIHGLESQQAVTLVSILRDGKIKMMSYAHYLANDDGISDLTKLPSVGGMYEGVEPMGFIWSMRLTPDIPHGMRLMKRNVLTPIKIDIKVYNGHFKVTYPELVSSECLAETSIERWYMSNEVERIEVRHGRLMATLFVPKGPGPYPGVLDLFGTIGGLVEYRASLLASRGFITMALAYFWPDIGITTDLEYFEEAADYILSHPKVTKDGIGIVGVSKGGELANLISIVTHKIRAVVVLNGRPTVSFTEHTYKGETFHQFYIPDTVKKEGGFCLSPEEELKDVYRKSLLPIERSKAKHLLIHSSDDGVCPLIGATLFPKRMVDHGRSIDDCKVVIYKDAGHLIEPPHSPHFRATLHKMYDSILIWGGYPKAHALAQEHCWHLMQDFFKTTLTSKTKPQSHL